MTISYPLALPTVTGFARMTVRKVDITAVSDSPYTGDEQVYEYPGKWWEGDITLPPLDAAAAAEWEAFFTSLKGHRGTFLMGDPTKATARGALGGTPLVNGAHAARVSVLNIKGASNNITGWAKAGDHLQLGTGSGARLHEVMRDANSDGSGLVTIDIWPNLRGALSDGDAITFTSPKGVFRRADNVLEIEKTPGPFPFSIPVREALR